MFFAYAAALASKSMLVTLPFALLLLDYWPLGRTVERPRSRLVFEKLPLFALSLAASANAFAAQAIARSHAPELGLSLRLAHAAVAYLRYLAFALWPEPALGDVPAPVRARARRPAVVGRGRGLFGRGARRDHGGCAGRAALALSRGRLALVPRHARSRDRTGADRGRRDSRIATATCR
jgi:hypothetical protein